MMNKRINVITLSAALCGLALGLMAPAAHGHGNNPKRPYTGSEDPDGGNEAPEGSEAVSRPMPGGGISDLGEGPSFGGQGGIIEIPPEVVRRLVILQGLPNADPASDGPIGIAPADMLPKNNYGGTPVQSVPRSAPAGGVIPTPGTLGLLGVATLILRRRRRR